jgi:hypothetical protein
MLKLSQNRSTFACGTIPGHFSILNLSTRPMIIKENSSQDRDGLPPFVNSWKQLYILLIGMLALQIVLFYLFMTHFQ